MNELKKTSDLILRLIRLLLLIFSFFFAIFGLSCFLSKFL